jgi:hypothetical protein
VRVEANVLDDPLAGEWCDPCALPSAFRFTVIVSPVHDPSTPWWRGYVWVCHDCGSQRTQKLSGQLGPRAFD